MFHVSKGLVAILTATMVLIGCNLSERAGDAASGHGAGSMAAGGDAEARQPLNLSIDIGSYGTLHVGGGPLTADEEGELKLTFTANSDLNTWEERDVGTGNMEMRPTLSLSLDGSVDSSCDDACWKHELNFIKSVSRTGKYISLNSMEAGNSITLNMKVTAQNNFTLTPRLTGEGIDETGKGVEITVRPSDDDEAPSGPKGPISRARKRALEAAGRTYNTTNYTKIDIEPLTGYDEAMYSDIFTKNDNPLKRKLLGMVIYDYKKT